MTQSLVPSTSVKGDLPLLGREGKTGAPLYGEGASAGPTARSPTTIAECAVARVLPGHETLMSYWQRVREMSRITPGSAEDYQGQLYFWSGIAAVNYEVHKAPSPFNLADIVEGLADEACADMATAVAFVMGGLPPVIAQQISASFFNDPNMPPGNTTTLEPTIDENPVTSTDLDEVLGVGVAAGG